MLPTIHVAVKVCELWLWLSLRVSPSSSARAIHSIPLGSQDNKKQLVVSIDSWSQEADAFHVRLLSRPFPQALHSVFFKMKNTKKSYWIAINIFSF